jgi:hypothetical protein
MAGTSSPKRTGRRSVRGAKKAAKSAAVPPAAPVPSKEEREDQMMERLVASYGLNLAPLRADLPAAFYPGMRMAALSLEKDRLGDRLDAVKAVFESAPAIAAWQRLAKLGAFSSVSGQARIVRASGDQSDIEKPLSREHALEEFERIVEAVILIVGRKRLTPEFLNHETAILDAIDELRTCAARLAVILRQNGPLQMPLLQLVDQQSASNLAALAHAFDAAAWRAITEEFDARRAALEAGAEEYEARRSEIDQASARTREERSITGAAIAWFQRDKLALANLLDRLANIRVPHHPAVAYWPKDENVELWIDAHGLQKLFIAELGDPCREIVGLLLQATHGLKAAPTNGNLANWHRRREKWLAEAPNRK